MSGAELPVFLGKGNYGVVTRDGDQAVKTVRIDRETGIQALIEVSIMSTYRHDALAHANDVCVRGDLLLIYQEIALCDLLFHILSQPDRRMMPEQAVLALRPMCRGLQFLHASNIIHGDIKPQNILVMQDGRIVLCDFGCAVICIGESARCNSGTMMYNAPETLTNLVIGYQSDIWSLGCVMYEMLSGVPLVPIEREAKSSVQRLKTAKTLRLWREQEGDQVQGDALEDELCCLPLIFSLPSDTPVTLIELVKEMTRYHARDRPSLLDILSSYGDGDGEDIGDIGCGIISKRTAFALALQTVLEYLEARNLELPQAAIAKAAEILSVSPVNSEVYVGACVHMSCNLHKIKLPLQEHQIPASVIVAAQLGICEATNFRVHKFSHSKLSTPFSCTDLSYLELAVGS